MDKEQIKADEIYQIIMELDEAIPLMKKSSSKNVKQAINIVQDVIKKLGEIK